MYYLKKISTYSFTPATSHYAIPGYTNPKPLEIPDHTNPKLLAIPDYSKQWRMPPGSSWPWMLLHTMKFMERSWHIEAQPSDFVMGVPTSVTIRVSTIFTVNEYYVQKSPSASGINISIEILDRTCQSTVFHKETLGKYARMVKFTRSELEEASCIHDNDYVPVRCTLKIGKDCVPVKGTMEVNNDYVPVKVDEKTKEPHHQKKPPAANKSKWWCLLRRSFSCFSNAKSKTNMTTNMDSKHAAADTEKSLV